MTTIIIIIYLCFHLPTLIIQCNHEIHKDFVKDFGKKEETYRAN